MGERQERQCERVFWGRGIGGGRQCFAFERGETKVTLQQKKIGFHPVKYFVLDEADRMMDMGFMPDVRRSVNDPNMPGKVRIHVQ